MFTSPNLLFSSESVSLIHDIVKTEQAIIDYSGGKTKLISPKKEKASSDMTVQYLTGGILEGLVKAIEEA